MDANLQAHVDDLRAKSALADSIVQLDNSNINLQADNAAKQLALTNAQQTINSLNQQMTTLQGQLDSANQQIQTISANDQSDQQKISTLSQQITTLNGQIAALQAKLAAAQRFLVATTPLTSLTGNNTSGSDSFTGQSNGNVRPGNVSNVPVSALLAPSLQNKPFVAHVQPWFGGNGGPGSTTSYHNFFSVGYDSADPAQIDKQANDMIRRGYSVVNIEYQGRAGTGSVSRDHENLCAINWLRRCEASGGKLRFMLCVVKGAYEWVAADTDIAAVSKRQAELVTLLKYIWATFAQSGAYFKVNGKPVIHWFDVLDAYDVTGALVAAAPSLAYVYRNSGGFKGKASAGAFSWFGSEADVYKAAALYPTLATFASVASGFNDTLSPWGQNRITPPAQGANWMGRFQEINQAFAAHPELLVAIQDVTWSDYHEATERETGIDAGLTVVPTITGQTLSWKCGGNNAAIHHFDVYLSNDGVNLAFITTLPASQTSYDLSQLIVGSGTYYVYVQAVGQPCILNAIGSVSYTV